MTLAAPLGQASFHQVVPGETWASIAGRYRVPLDLLWRSNGVTNPSLLHEGLRIYIPALNSEQGQHVLVAPAPSSVWRTAVVSGNPLSLVLLLNGWSSPIEGFGQPIAALDRRSSIVVSVMPSNTPSPLPPTPGTGAPTVDTAAPTHGALHRSRLGIQGHFSIPDDQRKTLLDMVAYELQFTWVKVQVNWSIIEYAPDQYSIELEKLDAFVQDAITRELKVMLSIVKAPDWARSTTDEDGPPLDYEEYYGFLRFLIERYGYRISAMEVWNEPNLRREWNGGTLSGAEYVRLLGGAFQTIKSIDPRITVISAGLAPTGVTNDVAIDDRLYLRQMYEAGLPMYADVVGIHPYGWANPPELRCCGDPQGPPTHNNHPTFFFLNTVEDYRAIQAEFGDEDRQLWATEFGWGTMQGLDLPVPDEQPFFAYVNMEQQARYIRDAYLMAQEWDFMGPMVLWNLNVATLDGHIDPNQAGYSILIDVGLARAAYNVLRDTPKVNE